jgi:hypothetical protein
MSQYRAADASLQDIGINRLAVPVIPANLEMQHVQAAFDALPTQASRRYYECPIPPTDGAGLIESHFKGVVQSNFLSLTPIFLRSASCTNYKSLRPAHPGHPALGWPINPSSYRPGTTTGPRFPI